MDKAISPIPVIERTFTLTMQDTGGLSLNIMLYKIGKLVWVQQANNSSFGFTSAGTGTVQSTNVIPFGFRPYLFNAKACGTFQDTTLNIGGPCQAMITTAGQLTL